MALNLPRFRLHPYAAIGRQPSPGQLARSNSSGGAGVLERVLALFPINFSNFSVPFSALESYPLGPVVLDLIGMVLLVYGVLALVSTPVAAVSFRRHRVA